MFNVLGNGVVIHLPGLFEEAEKNLQKGKGKLLEMMSGIESSVTIRKSTFFNTRQLSHGVG